MIIQGDCLEVLKTLPDESVDCVITSPPYWGLRDYGVDGQLGLEKTPEEYVENLVNVFREVKRVLKKEGTVWLNLGDSYYNYRPGQGQRVTPNSIASQKAAEMDVCPRRGLIVEGLKEKDLVGIPWRVAFALQADGWYLRQDIIWHKPNPMPESVSDRCTKSHEYIFLLAKSQKYYFDNEAIKEPANYERWGHQNGAGKYKDTSSSAKMIKSLSKEEITEKFGNKRNKRSVWTITTKPFKEAHFATFPEALIEPMVKAGCPEFVCKKCGIARQRIFGRATTKEVHKSEVGKSKDKNGGVHRAIGEQYAKWMADNPLLEKGFTGCGCSAGFEGGVVLDPFIGAGTTAVVAKKLKRNWLGIELNPKYIEIAEKRINLTPEPLI